MHSELKASDKKTLQHSKDGVLERNIATGESEKKTDTASKVNFSNNNDRQEFGARAENRVNNSSTNVKSNKNNAFTSSESVSGNVSFSTSSNANKPSFNSTTEDKVNTNNNSALFSDYKTGSSSPNSNANFNLQSKAVLPTETSFEVNLKNNNEKQYVGVRAETQVDNFSPNGKANKTSSFKSTESGSNLKSFSISSNVNNQALSSSPTPSANFNLQSKAVLPTEAKFDMNLANNEKLEVGVKAENKTSSFEPLNNVKSQNTRLGNAESKHILRTESKIDKFDISSQKLNKKIIKAENKLPTQKKLKLVREFNTTKGKASYSLKMEKTPLYMPKHDSRFKQSQQRVSSQISQQVHSKISQYEKDNSGVEGFHLVQQKTAAVASTLYKWRKEKNREKPFLKVKKLKDKQYKSKLKKDLYSKKLEFDKDNTALKTQKVESNQKNKKAVLKENTKKQNQDIFKNTQKQKDIKPSEKTTSTTSSPVAKKSNIVNEDKSKSVLKFENKIKRLEKKDIRTNKKIKKNEKSNLSELKIKHKLKFDEDKGKIKGKLKFEKSRVTSPKRTGLVTLSLKGAASSISSSAHRKMSEHGGDNSGVVALNKTTSFMEGSVRKSLQRSKNKKYSAFKKERKLQVKSQKIQSKLQFQSKKLDALKKNDISTLSKKKAALKKKASIKKNSKKRNQMKLFKKNKSKKLSKSVSLAKNNVLKLVSGKAKIAVLGIGLLLIVVVMPAAIIISLAGGGSSSALTGFATQIVPVSNADLSSATKYWSELAYNLMEEYKKIPENNPGYDEYTGTYVNINQDSYAFIAMLSAYFTDYGTDWQYNDEVKNFISLFFKRQFSIEKIERTETRERIIQVEKTRIATREVVVFDRRITIPVAPYYVDLYKTIIEEYEETYIEDEIEYYEVKILESNIKGDANIYTSTLDFFQLKEFDSYFNALCGHQIYTAPIENWLLNISEKYGYTACYNTTNYINNGIDIRTTIHDPIKSIAKGTITGISYSESFGNYVTIQSGEYKIIITDLSNITVTQNQEILSGQQIGVAAGSSIHIEIIDSNGVYIDPVFLIKK